MDAVLWLFDDQQRRHVVEIGDQGERDDPQRTLRQPGGRYLVAPFVLDAKIGVVVLFPLAKGDSRDLGQCRAHVRDPGGEAFRVGLPQVQCEPGEVLSRAHELLR